MGKERGQPRQFEGRCKGGRRKARSRCLRPIHEAPAERRGDAKLKGQGAVFRNLRPARLKITFVPRGAPKVLRDLDPIALKEHPHQRMLRSSHGLSKAQGAYSTGAMGWIGLDKEGEAH